MALEPVVTGAEGAPSGLVLASTSRWRQSLLAAAGVRCTTADPAVDEASIGGSDPVDVARRRALAKARAVSARQPGALVIGADQVVHLDGETIGKPASEAEWRARLAAFRGRQHQLTTAVALVDGRSADEVFDVQTLVRFRADLDDAELEAYIRFGEARGCAGGYMVEQRGAWLVESLDGDWTNVVGMPVFALIGRLRTRGYRLGPDGLGVPARPASTHVAPVSPSPEAP